MAYRVCLTSQRISLLTTNIRLVISRYISLYLVIIKGNTNVSLTQKPKSSKNKFLTLLPIISINGVCY